jgi:hypothetical protein
MKTATAPHAGLLFDSPSKETSISPSKKEERKQEKPTPDLAGSLTQHN